MEALVLRLARNIPRASTRIPSLSTVHRKETPSPEHQNFAPTTVMISPKRLAFGSPTSANKRPAVIHKTIPLPEPFKKPFQPLVTELLKAEHIVFEDFSLINEQGVPRAPKRAEIDLIFNLFEDTYSVSFEPPFLIIRVKKLPQSGTWPVTVAGTPLYLTTEKYARAFDPGVIGLTPALGEDVHFTKGNMDLAHDAVLHYFEGELGLIVQEVSFWGNFLKIVFRSPFDISRLPTFFANLPCQYHAHTNARQIETFTPSGIIRPEFNTFAMYNENLRGCNVYMNNPFAGICPGQIMACGKFRSEGEPHRPWVEQYWVYFGNEVNAVPDGSCGAAIWTDTNDVVAFFRFFSGDSKIGIGIDATILADRFDIVRI